uniref:(California timema) hypothetical protein n=1 Tax=Timema californicum TaxID=61474 RepID=A0A7R9IWQ7_TIMCA|nr:unnamed protein product [Timema californicum]
MGHDVRTTELTAEGHLVGLLDRDQRTVLSISATRFDGRRSRKSRGCDSFVVSATSSSSGGPATTSSRCLGRDRTSFRRGRRLSKDRRTNHQQQRSKPLLVQKPSSKWHLLNRTLNRLGEVLVIGVCLLTVVRIPSVMSAPIDRPRPKWINPCGLGSGSSDDLGGGDAELTEFGPRLTDHELLTQIVVTANNALSHAEHFREKYSRRADLQKVPNRGQTQGHRSETIEEGNSLPSAGSCRSS